MSEYDPDELNDEAEGNVDIDYTGVISDIDQTTAADIFGEDAHNPDREVIEVLVDTEAGDDFTQVFSLPNPDNPARSWSNPNFKLGQFRSKYGSVPEQGMEVNLTVDDSGFLAIEL